MVNKIRLSKGSTQQTRHLDGGPTLAQDWVKVSCLLGSVLGFSLGDRPTLNEGGSDINTTGQVNVPRGSTASLP